MAFSTGWASAIAGITGIFLLLSGIRNMQSGWRHRQVDDVLDIFMAWARANPERDQGFTRGYQVQVTARPSTSLTPPAPSTPRAPQSDQWTPGLMALHTALQPSGETPNLTGYTSNESSENVTVTDKLNAESEHSTVDTVE